MAFHVIAVHREREDDALVIDEEPKPFTREQVSDLLAKHNIASVPMKDELRIHFYGIIGTLFILSNVNVQGLYGLHSDIT